jgi:hypothetical protein
MVVLGCSIFTTDRHSGKDASPGVAPVNQFTPLLSLTLGAFMDDARDAGALAWMTVRLPGQRVYAVRRQHFLAGAPQGMCMASRHAHLAHKQHHSLSLSKPLVFLDTDHATRCSAVLTHICVGVGGRSGCHFGCSKHGGSQCGLYAAVQSSTAFCKGHRRCHS